MKGDFTSGQGLGNILWKPPLLTVTQGNGPMHFAGDMYRKSNIWDDGKGLLFPVPSGEDPQPLSAQSWIKNEICI